MIIVIINIIITTATAVAAAAAVAAAVAAAAAAVVDTDLHLPQLGDVGGQVEVHAIPGSRQQGVTDQQDQHEDVRGRGCHVHNLRVTRHR